MRNRSNLPWENDESSVATIPMVRNTGGSDSSDNDDDDGCDHEDLSEDSTPDSPNTDDGGTSAEPPDPS